MNKKSILITGGGTGGHISPGISLYEEFKNREIPVSFLAAFRDKRFSSLDDIEKEDLFLYNAPQLTKNPIKLPFFVLKFLLAILKARKVLKKRNISAVIGMGGYVSAPALLAAKWKKIPVYLCEQNSVPGKVTKSFQNYAVQIFGTFNIDQKFLERQDKLKIVGNPIRKSIFKDITKQSAKEKFFLGHSEKVILVIGGSQGAVAINELIYNMKKNYPDKFKNIGIIWSTGDYSYNSYKEKIHNETEAGSVYISKYIDDMGAAYKASDLAISRSGAGVMMELAAMEIPSILIPYPYAADNHQEINADEFVTAGASIKLNDSSIDLEDAANQIFDLLESNRRLDVMKKRSLDVSTVDAVVKIADDILGEN